MPGYGDHYKASTGVAANPFEEKPPTLTEYTAKELATLQSRLDKQLGPEFISSRPGAGGAKVHYITAEKVINLANQVFGFNGWSSQIREITPDFVDEAPGTGKITLGLSIIVRVTLRDGTYHEDVGYGHIENCKGKAAAFEKAKKEAATDALKRALRTFGNVLGNCLYDKDYLGRVTKIKIAPSKWDGEKLHRHPDFAPIKNDATTDTEMKDRGVSAQNEQTVAATVANTENEDEFGGDVFDEVDIAEGHPDEVILPPEKPVIKHDTHHGGASGPETPRRNAIQTPDTRPQHMEPSKSSSDQSQQHQQSRPPSQTNYQQIPKAPQTSHPTATRPQPNRSNPPQPGTKAESQQSPAYQQRNLETSIGFTTSRAADLLTSDNQPPNVALPPFNPKAESQSIRRTSGVNHTTSEPIRRQVIGGPTPQPQTAVSNVPIGGSSISAPVQHAQNGHVPSTTNFVNPAADTSRRIGMPNAVGSPIPHANRNAYRPPGPAAQKRSYAAAVGVEEPTTATRRPLADVSNTVAAQGQGVTIGDTAGDEAKKLKTTDGPHG